MKNTKAFKVLVGSHLHNLNTEKSDKDYKMFVYPTFVELLEGQRKSSEKITEEEDVEIHDIRKLISLLSRSNPTYLDILFSEDVEDYSGIYKKIVPYRENIARMNLSNLYNASKGMALRQAKSINKKYVRSVEDEIIAQEVYKHAQHCVRMSMIIDDYARRGFKDYYKVVRLAEDDPKRSYLLRIKNQEVALKNIPQIVEDAISLIESREEEYISKTRCGNTKVILESIIRQDVREELKKELEKEIDTWEIK